MREHDDVRVCIQLLHDELVCNVLRIRPRFSFATLHQLIIFDPIQTDLLIKKNEILLLAKYDHYLYWA